MNNDVLRMRVKPEVDAYLARVPDEYLESEIESKRVLIESYRESYGMALTDQGRSFWHLPIACEEEKLVGLLTRARFLGDTQPLLSGPYDDDPDPEDDDVDWSGISAGGVVNIPVGMPIIHIDLPETH